MNGKVLATGIDLAGRKQYIYSNNSKKLRETRKYNQLIKLSNNILKLKKQINNDLLAKTMTKKKLIALMLKIMDLCNFRCGNKKYEEKYGSYGLTTLHKKHISIKKDYTEIDFVGKKGVINNCLIYDENIRQIIKNVYDLSDNTPYLFSIKYRSNIINVSIGDLNKYLEIYGITSKDLRTWNANIIFLQYLKKNINEISQQTFNNMLNTKKLRIKKKIIRESIKQTAILLHHTPSICKSSYIYKDIIIQLETNNKIIKKLYNDKYTVEDIISEILIKK